MQELDKYIDQIKKLCHKNRVKSLFAFGSAAKDNLQAGSDIDLVVDIDEKDPISYSDYYFNLKFALEKLFERNIDLLEQKAIKNPYLKQQIEETKVLIYGKWDKTWLADIKKAIEEVKSFLPEKKNFRDFQSDIKTQRAIERNIEIIGEAVNRILKANPDYNIENARSIVDTRNRIIHGYDTVSKEIIWSIIIRDLPKLEKEIDRLIDID